MRCCKSIRPAGHGLSRTETRTGHCSSGGKSMGGGRPAWLADELTSQAMGCARLPLIWGYPFHPPGQTAAAAHRTPERLADVHPDPAGDGTRFGRARRWRTYSLSPQVQLCAGSPPPQAVTHSFKPTRSSWAQRGGELGHGGWR